jgi:hypothetical protein
MSATAVRYVRPGERAEALVPRAWVQSLRRERITGSAFGRMALILA